MELQRKKIAIIGHDILGARDIFTTIYKAFPDCTYRVYITKGLYYNRSYVSSMWKLIREASWAFCFQKCIDMTLYRISGDSLKNRIKDLPNVDFIETDDINSSAILENIRSFAPDVALSTFTMNLYRQPILDIPPLFLATHPSILPAYRGLEVYYWAMANGEENLGISVFLASAKIDDGKIVDYLTFPIKPHYSADGLYRALTHHTGALYVKVLKTFFEAGNISLCRSVPETSASYFPMPTSQAAKLFKQRKLRYRDEGLIPSFLAAVKQRFSKEKSNPMGVDPI